jgi:hypothetical protein
MFEAMFQQPEPASEHSDEPDAPDIESGASIAWFTLVMVVATTILIAVDCAATAVFVPLLRVLGPNSGLGWFLRWLFACAGALISFVTVFAIFSAVPRHRVYKSVAAIAAVCAVLVFGVLEVDPQFTFAFALRPLDLGHASVGAILQAGASQSFVDIGLSSLLVARVVEKYRARKADEQARLYQDDPSRPFQSVWRR